MNSLIVPMELEVLVVNDRVRETVPFQRWRANFRSLDDNLSPEPEPFTNNEDMTDPAADGVYLQWQLPHALRRGQHDPASGKTTFPLVPNRWLVLRYSGPQNSRTATAWVVESDFVTDDSQEGTSAFLNPYKQSRSSVHIGRKVPAASWSEGAPRDLFLTAAGAGLLTFTAYQPYNENVFSLHDPLDDVADSDTLSYQVIGWYSATGADPLADGADPATLGWVPVASGQGSPTRSLYAGTALGVAWDRAGAVPDSDRPTSDTGIEVAVGNSSIDALTALIEMKTGDTEAASLLDAIQYGLLDTGQDGAEAIDQAVHRAWFGPSNGGYTWEITATTQTAAQTPAPVPDWLTTLITDQAAHDDLVRQLADMRWRLYCLWWIDQRDDIPEDLLDPDDFDTQLDPDTDGTLAQRIRQLVADLVARRDTRGQHPHRIPWGATPDELATAAAGYAADHGLPAGLALRRVPLPEFYQANDPVVLLNGVKTPPAPDLSAPLPCRGNNDLVSGIDLGHGIVAPPDSVPRPPQNALPNGFDGNGLFNEFWLLDQAQLAGTLAGATADPAAKVIGTLPAYGAVAWRQPWSPLYLIYQLRYYPIPYQSDGQRHWDFDGAYYDWNGTGAPDDYEVYTGRIYLTPHATFNLASRLRHYIDTHPDADPATRTELTTLADQIATWDLLSQALDGLDQRIARRDPAPNVNPASIQPDQKTVVDLIGGKFQHVPILGTTPKRSWPKSTFPQVRAGQFSFIELAVVDRFGQAINPINSDNYVQRELVLPEDLRPKITVEDLEPKRFVELPRVCTSRPACASTTSTPATTAQWSISAPVPIRSALGCCPTTSTTAWPATARPAPRWVNCA
ncbi:hypothetical protein [Nocardia arthritidis]|uniref:Uncharacterized protein n=1 Tax=Nocardia arthritidis TaxID=228602 RepID=A0A6G9YLA5_9NOCA|nr:hypothetical protein [Nocardia arthritidis]QIS14049.1 hypothetical protein F5544_31035 [Nocardia arthritidis]